MTIGVLLTGIVILAAWFRWYDISNYPPGLFPDEAANGEDVQLILQGDIRPFYERSNGREGLFFFLQAVSVKLFGVGVWQMHVVSGLVGILTVLAIYFATRVWFGRLSGLLAALLLATNQWHVTLSRTGFRAILIPLVIALFTALVGATIVAVKNNRKGASYMYAAAAGAVFASGWYTYIAFRIMAPIIVAVALLILLDDLVAFVRRKRGVASVDSIQPVVDPALRTHIERYWRHVLLALATCIVVTAPLALYFVRHPDAFIGRAGQVSVFNQDLQREVGGGTLAGTLLYSTRHTLVSFFAGRGDLNWRHNVAGYPLLNPFVALLFLLGLGWTLRGTYEVVRGIFAERIVHLGLVYPYLLLVLVGMLLPTITTAEGIPHGLRSIGLITPIFILAGTAAAVTLRWLARKVSFAWQPVVYGAAIGFFILGIAYDGALYFFVARNTPAAYAAYRGDLTETVSYLKEFNARNPSAETPYLVIDSFSLQTVRFLTNDDPQGTEHIWRQVEPNTSHLIPLMGSEVIVFTQPTLTDAARYEKMHPGAELIQSRRNRFGEEILRVYGVRQGDGTADPASLDA